MACPFTEMGQLVSTAREALVACLLRPEDVEAYVERRVEAELRRMSEAALASASFSCCGPARGLRRSMDGIHFVSLV